MVCKCCEIRKVKVGHKAKVSLSYNTEMVLDRYKDHDDVFIHTSYVDSNGSWLNDSYEIEYCPLCGYKF